MQWQDRYDSKQAIATALDLAAEKWGLQIAFFCNESRDGQFFDADAAAEIATRMSVRAILVPHEYYAPDEAIALLSAATLTLGQRYHTVIQSVLADTVPVAIPRGQKMAGLCAELGIPTAGTVGAVGTDQILAALGLALDRREQLQNTLRAVRAELAVRAEHNLDLIADLPPYDRAFKMMSTASTKSAADESKTAPKTTAPG